MANEIIRPEIAGHMLGVPGRFFNIIGEPGAVVLLNQEFKTEQRRAKGYGKGAVISASVRFDDQCKNGRNTFSITADIRKEGTRGDHGWIAGGCCHEDIAAAFPELAPLIKWDLTSSDGPLHYIANTIYHAGDRDHHGLRAGERRQIINGRTKEPAWHLVAIDANGAEIELHTIPRNIDGPERPACPYSLEYRPWCRVGEGKARELNHARSSAVWPDATDAELMQEPAALKAALEARHPALMAEFRAVMDACGFMWDATGETPPPGEWSGETERKRVGGTLGS